MKSYCFGIDIGGTAVKLGLFDLSGELILKREIPTRLEDHGSLVLPDTAAAAEQMLSELNAGWQDTGGIGMAVPGPLTEDGFVSRSVNLGWENMNARDIMRDLTGLDAVAAENDAKTAALGEWWKGGHGDCRSAVMITIGTAVGGGVVVDGKILRGAFCAAGELSHIQIHLEETELCACGKFGHLQQYVAAEAIIRDHARRSGKAPLPDAKAVFDAAKQGDAAALATVDMVSRSLARVMAMVSAVVDPELYLIGGGIAKAGDFLLDRIRKDFREIVLFTSEDARIEPATLGSDAGMYGAAKLILSNL